MLDSLGDDPKGQLKKPAGRASNPCTSQQAAHGSREEPLYVPASGPRVARGTPVGPSKRPTGRARNPCTSQQAALSACHQARREREGASQPPASRSVARSRKPRPGRTRPPGPLSPCLSVRRKKPQAAPWEREGASQPPRTRPPGPLSPLPLGPSQEAASRALGARGGLSAPSHQAAGASQPPRTRRWTSSTPAWITDDPPSLPDLPECRRRSRGRASHGMCSDRHGPLSCRTFRTAAGRR